MNSNENSCNCQVKGNYQGPLLWLTRWQWIISLSPPLVEIATWNDWLESSYVAPPLSQGDNAKSVASFTHKAYLDLGEHYIRWYKTGSEPAVTEDALYLFYYTQSKNAASSGDSCKVLHSEQLSDKVYVTAVLTDAATVVLNSGSANSQTFTAPAGINTYSIDFNEGQQSATLSRGGSVVKSVNGGIQISNSRISRYNFNVYSTSVLELISNCSRDRAARLSAGVDEAEPAEQYTPLEPLMSYAAGPTPMHRGGQ